MVALLVSLSLIGYEKAADSQTSDKARGLPTQAEPMTINLGIYSSACVFDLDSDNNNTVHFIWEDNDGSLHYANILQNAVVNEEVIPDSHDVRPEFQRPRIQARPDGQSVHITWMDPKPGTWLVHVWKDSSGWHREDVWSGTGAHISQPVGGADLSGKLHFIGQVWTPLPNFWSTIKYWTGEPGNYNNGWTLVEGSIKWRDTDMFIDHEGGVHAVYKSGQDPGKYVYCENGGTIIDAPVLDIPIPPGEKCVSFGDLFVDRDLNVHHAHMSYSSESVWYEVKMAGSNEWTGQHNVSNGPMELCHHEEYDNAWPTLAVGPEGRVYVAWADMPCPDQEANRISLAVKEDGNWSLERLTTDAHITFHSMPSITANENGIFLIWRDWHEELILYSIIHKELFISTPHANQNICDDVDKIEAKVQVPGDFARIEFYADDELLGEATAEPYEIEWDISQYEKGDHTIKVIGYKTNSEIIEDEITVDMNCPPTIAIANLIHNASVAGVVDVIAQAADDKDDIEKVEFWVDGKLKSTVSEAPYTFNWNTQAYQQGSAHRCNAVVYDESSVTDEDTVRVIKYPIYPPIEVSGEAKVNQTLFMVEYYANLTWQPNPQNTNTIVGFKIYYVEDGEQVLLDQVDGNTFEFNHRNASANENEYVYVVTSVAGNGKESHGAYVILEKPQQD
jgi:hypothetical protein